MTRRLLASYLMVTAFVVLVLAVPLGVTVARSERAALIAAVERDAFVLAGLVEDTLEQGGSDNLDRVADEYADRTDARVVIVDSAGIARGDSRPLSDTPRDFSTRSEISTALSGRIAEGERFSDTLGSGLLFVAVPVTSGGQIHGAVRVSYPTTAVDARIRRSWLTLAAVGAVALIAAGLIGTAVARWVARPVRRLRGTARELARGNLAARAGADTGPEEIRALAEALNTMAGRLESLLDAQQRFVADASHQLRSPLTALRLRLEGIAGLSAAQERQVEAAIDESARLGRLIDGLLTLARAEGSRGRLETVDVNACLRDRAEAWEPLATEMGVDLSQELAAVPSALEQPGALAQIVDNYLANALQVAPPGSTICLRSGRADGRVAASVIDHGPGMAASARDRAFDRFWRGADGGEGFGLGLAIVARLAAASGGRVALQPGPDGHGTEARVELPGVVGDDPAAPGAAQRQSVAPARSAPPAHDR